MNKLYCTLVLLFSTTFLFSQTQWIGADGADWQTASNWSNGLPATGNDALITSTGKPAINNPLIIDYGVTSFSGDIAINADVFNTGNIVNSGGNVALAPGVQFVNSGAVTFTNDGPFSNDGIFINYGNFNQNGNGTFDNNASGVFINYGSISNIGNFTNNGMVENRGALTNAATYINNSLTTNYGSFINTFVSTLENNAGANFVNATGGQMFIDNIFNNAGEVNDNGSTTVNASGNVNNTGTMNLNGQYVMSIAFANNGTVNQSGNFKVNFGTLDNNSLWVNTGFTENVGTFNNNVGATLTNNDALMNASCSRFYQYSNNPIVNMTNDGVLYELGGTVGINGSSQGRVLTNANDVPQPFLDCRDIQIQTDDQGNAVITAGDVLNDADAKYCNIVTIILDQEEFTCSDLGVNQVTVTMTDGFGESSTCSPNVTVVERSPNPCNTSFLNYCASASTQTTGEFIQSVSLGDLTNTSTGSLYTDFTTEVAILEFGNFYDFEAIASGANGTVSWGVWIDWNNDGDFDDVTEEILIQTDGSTTANAVVNVPGVALPGTTRMRVGMRRTGAVNACGSVTFGEYEDYTVKIISDITIQNCVGDIVVNAFAGASEANVGWIPPKGFSTCQNSIDIELLDGLPNGSAFPLGETVNTFRFYDGCDNEETCSFTVTVNPTPVNFSLTCPSDVVLLASPGLGGAIANWVAPFPSATCQAGVNLPTQVTGPSLGSFLPIGSKTTICYETTDNCGNADNCCFDVFVGDPAESISIDNCPNSISVDAAPGQPGTVVTYPVLTATSTCATGGVAVVLQDGLPSGSYFPGGNTLVTYRASDNCNSADLCSFTVSVTGVPAEITDNCPDDLVVDVQPGGFNAVVDFPAISATSTCAGGVNIVQTQGLPSGSMFPLGNTVVQFMIADECGGMENCTFNVTLNSNPSTLDFACPADVTVNAAPGEVGATVTWANPSISTDCFSAGAEFTLVSALSSGELFPLGTQEVIYFANDNCGGSAGCSFFVTVEPTQANLNLTCRNNITRNVDLGTLPIVNFSNATGTTTCNGNVDITRIAGPVSGSAFEVGVTTITYRGTDDCGNVELCSFDVIVNVNLPANDPEITIECLDDITVTAAPGQTVASVGFDVPTATTTCNGGSGNGGGNEIYIAPSICADRTVSNVNQCNSVSKTMWINFVGLDNNYSSTNSQFIEYSDGTATFTGTIINNSNSNIHFDVAAFFSGRTTTPPTGSPKTNSCANVTNFSNFYYYTNTIGILTGKNNAQGALIKFSRVGEAFQVGPGGDVLGNNLTLGASGWLQLNIISQPSGTLNLVLGNQEANDADFNFKISGNGNICRDNGTDCSEVPNSISGYTYLGQYQGKKYFSSNSTMSFATARNAAEGLGGNIVTIGSQEENDFITSAMATSGYIGFTDQASEGNFVWINGESVNYTNWNANEPNNSNNEDFTQIRTDGLWNDIRNITSRHQTSIIEIGCPARSCASISDNISGYTFIGEFENSKYYVANGAQSWESSRDAAIAAGGHLAVVTSQAENDFINNNGTASSGSFWLGLQNVNQTTTFQWINGEPVSYTNWNDGEPNETHENVFARMIDGSGKWTDRTENLRYNGVLEIECGSGFSSTCQANGRLKREVWNDLAANRFISSIPLNTRPDLTDIITSFETPFNIGDRYGTRVSGWVVAPQTGNYTFWISSDNNGELWLSTDENPNNTSLIASLDGNSNRNEWDRFPSQQSVQISLVAGTSYYIEALLKENSGGDHLAVGWQLPDGTLNRPITGEYLSDQPCRTGSSEATITQVTGLAPNTNFPIGTTTVIYEVTDECGNVAYCEFDVTVDQPNSAIALNNCPTDVTVTAAAGATSAIATFGTPTATSDCTQGDVVVSQTSGFASGAAFPVGQTTVIYRAVDGCGNEQFCSFFVTVESTPVAPTTITENCLDNISVTTDIGGNSGIATWNLPNPTTDCPGSDVEIFQIGGLAPGSAFPIGNTVIFYRLEDDCGNVASCAFNVNVNSIASEVSIACPANVSVNTAPDSEFATATWGDPTASSDCFTGSVDILQIGGLPEGSLFPVGNNIITYKATDACGQFAVCNFIVTVNATPITNIDPCVNNGGDADGDGVCADVDCDDMNPLVSSPGDTCDDGNAGTENDTVQADCGCVGTPIPCFADGGDADGDGICADFDCDDNDPNVSNQGDACDDGDATTTGDVILADCSCAGTSIFDCPALGGNIGDSCNDGNANTENDTVQSDCSCLGTPIVTFDCPALSANIGDACDDGNPTTTNDMIQEDCSCLGTTPQCLADGGTLTGGPFNFCVDGTPDNIPANGLSLTGVSGTNSGWIVIDGSGTILELPSTFTTTNFDASGVGTCFIYSIAYENGLTGLAVGNNLGILNGCFDLSNRIDVIKEICNTVDCPALSANIGDTCDDGDATTENDTVQADCSCAGTPIEPGTCEAVWTIDAMTITIENVDAPISTVKVFDNTFSPIFSCDNFSGGTPCNDTEVVTVPAIGTYFIQIQTYTDWSNQVCNIFEEITITGGAPCLNNGGDADGDGVCADVDCDDSDATIGEVGSTCNDGDATTENDVIQTDCSCAGTPIGNPCANNGGDADGDGVCADFDCDDSNPNISNIGDVCDDGDADTSNDVIQSDCSCAGVATSCTASYTIDGFDVTLDGLNAPIVSAKVLDNTFSPLFACDNFGGGTACGTTETVTVPSPGLYWVQIQTYSADWSTQLCNILEQVEITDGPPCANNGGDADGDGVCADVDCDDSNANIGAIGSTCNDGDATTENDVIQSDCSCAGTPIGNPCANNGGDADGDGVCADFDCDDSNPNISNIGDACDDGDADTSNDVIQSDCSCAGVATSCTASYTIDGFDVTLDGLNAPIVSAKVLDNTFSPLFACDNFGGGTACGNSETVTVPSPGLYWVQIQTYSADWSTQLCNILEQIEINGVDACANNGGDADGDGVCADIDCDDTDATVGEVGSTCDDGDTTTENDVIQSDCSCAGTPIPPCTFNVTDGGTITGDETLCPNIASAPIMNETLPAGGSGTMEYIWLSSTVGCPTTLSEIISGANQSTYDPGTLSETTYFRRCARRAGCSDWFTGESNCIVKTVDDTDCEPINDCTISYEVIGNDLIINGLTAPINSVQIADAAFVPVFTCNEFATLCGSTETITLTPGTYFISAQTYLDYSTQLCNIFEAVTIGGNANRTSILGLNAAVNQGIVDLTWTNNTGSENDYFEIEKSEDGINFETIETTESAEDDAPKFYQTTDTNPLGGANFYRVKLTHLNGSVDYSETRQIHISDLEDFGLFPNPAQESVSVDLEGFSGKEIEIRLTDQFGRLLNSTQIDQVSQRTHQIDLSKTKNGFYHVWIFPEGGKPVGKKLVVGRRY